MRQLVASTWREESEVTDTHKRPGQHVQQEAAQKLDARERHVAKCIVVVAITVAERDVVGIRGDDASVADGGSDRYS